MPALISCRTPGGAYQMYLGAARGRQELSLRLSRRRDHRHVNTLALQRASVPGTNGTLSGRLIYDILKFSVKKLMLCRSRQKRQETAS